MMTKNRRIILLLFYVFNVVGIFLIFRYLEMRDDGVYPEKLMIKDLAVAIIASLYVFIPTYLKLRKDLKNKEQSKDE